MGTAEGITTFLPKDVNVSKQKLGKVFLTRMTVNGHSMNPMQEQFDLESTENSFTLEFSMLNYQDVGNIAYQYRFNGSETWQQTNEGENRVSFNQLQPGDYTLEVRATNNGSYSESSLMLHFNVAKPWYLTWWAYLLYALIVGGFLFLLLYNFERQRRRDLEETKMRFLINATHDIRSPLTLIMGAVEKLNVNVNVNDNVNGRGTRYEVRGAKTHPTPNTQHPTPNPQPSTLDAIDTIDRNAKRLLLLVNQILDDR